MDQQQNYLLSEEGKTEGENLDKFDEIDIEHNEEENYSSH